MSWYSPKELEEMRMKQDIQNMVKGAQAILFHIETIEQSDDKEIIELSVDAIQLIENNVAEALGETERKNMRTVIRNGLGDYVRIQQKCIDLGVV